jgi:hypothetical protein
MGLRRARVERHHRDQASAVPFVVDKFSPTVVPHLHAPHEAASPIIAVSHAILVCNRIGL